MEHLRLYRPYGQSEYCLSPLSPEALAMQEVKFNDLFTNSLQFRIQVNKNVTIFLFGIMYRKEKDSRFRMRLKQGILFNL